jgi:kynurenine formamidase
MSLGCVVARGILLDVCRALATEPLAAGYEITPADLEETLRHCRVEFRPGDAVLIRTGWGALWSKPELYIGSETGCPGIGLQAAQWLADRRATFLGGDTLTVEVRHPSAYQDPLPVHTEMLVEQGIPLIENMNLEDLARVRPKDFLFVVLPLPLPGSSGSPVRPIAIVDE